MARIHYEEAWSDERDLKIEWVDGRLVIWASKDKVQHVEIALSADEVKRLKEVIC